MQISLRPRAECADGCGRECLPKISMYLEIMATSSGKAKGGYDCQFVDPPPKTYECSVCLLTLRDPHVTTCCGNYLCEPCFQRVRTDRGSCPLCNDTEFNAFLHKGVQREINALKVRCVHQDQGCEWVGDWGTSSNICSHPLEEEMGVATRRRNVGTSVGDASSDVCLRNMRITNVQCVLLNCSFTV